MQSLQLTVPANSAAATYIPIASNIRRAALALLLEGLSQRQEVCRLGRECRSTIELTSSKIEPPGDLMVDGTSTSTAISQQ